MAATLGEDRITLLRSILMVSRGQLLKIAARIPALSTCPPETLTNHLIVLKADLPNVDVALLLELMGDRILEGKDDEVTARMAFMRDRYAYLVARLPGADLRAMLLEVPVLLLDEEVVSGIEGMHEMWPQLTPEALRDSHP